MIINAEILLIITISLILLISPFISNILKLPIAIVEIVLGALFIPTNDNHIFDMLAEFGFLYLMLLAGMEVNLKEIIKSDTIILKKASLYLVLLYILSIGIVYILNLNKIYTVIFPLISIGLMLSIQQEIGKQNWLELALKIGIFGELLSILVLTITSGYVEFGFSVKLLYNILMLIGFSILIALIFIFHRTFFWWFPKIKYLVMPKSNKYFQDVRIAMSLFFIMIAFLILLHLDVVLGAFLVGIFISTFFPHNKELEHKLTPFGFGFIITIFFIHVGNSIDIKSISFNMIKDAIFITLSMISIRIIASIIFLKELKNKFIEVGLSLSMPLTLLIATSTIAFQHKFISNYEYNVLIFAAILEVLISMIGIKILEKRAN